MNYSDLKERYKWRDSPWHYVRFVSDGKYFYFESDIFKSIVVDPKASIWSIDHRDETVEPFRFDSDLIRIGQNLTEQFPNSAVTDNLYSFSRYVRNHPAEYYLLYPNEEDAKFPNVFPEKIGYWLAIAILSREDAILLKLHNPNALIYHGEV